MKKEAYERLKMDVTEFDIEDVITTSGVEPSTDPAYDGSDGGDSPYGVDLGF